MHAPVKRERSAPIGAQSVSSRQLVRALPRSQVVHDAPAGGNPFASFGGSLISFSRNLAA